MRKLSIVLGTLLFAGIVHAATLNYTGSLEFLVSTLPGSAALEGSGQAVIGTTGLHADTMAISGGVFGPVSASLPVTNSGTINSVIFTNMGNDAGSFVVSGGPPGGGPMGLTGTAKICLVFAPCAYAGITVPLTGGFGIGGTQVASGSVSITMQHNAWQLGTASLTIHTPVSNVTTPLLPGGFAHGPASLTSSTAQPSGAVQLVTVSKTYTSLTTVFPELPLIGVLAIHFIPEPSTALLLGSGVVGLAVLGRRLNRR
jgi:hypothetical protein